MKTKYDILKILPWLISIAVFFFLIKKIDLQALSQIQNLLLGQVENTRPMLIWVAVLLSMSSVLIESRKWQLLMDSLHSISFGESLRMTMRGLSSSLMMPNRSGDFIGKIYLLPSEIRPQAFGLSAVANLMQLANTLVWGSIALVWFVLQTDVISGLHLPSSVLWVPVLLLLLFLVFRSFFMEKIRSSKWYGTALKSLKPMRNLPLHLWISTFLLSTLRYAIFITQYYLILRGMGVDIAWYQVLIAQSAVYITLAAIPHTMIMDVALRGPISLVFYSVFGVPAGLVLLSAYCLYFANILLPALIGLPFLKTVKSTRTNKI